MSEAGSNAPCAPSIQNARLRDVVAAYNALVRPTVILVCGFSVAAACWKQPQLGEIVLIAAGLAGGVGYLRSMDKKSSVGPNASDKVDA